MNTQADKVLMDLTKWLHTRLSQGATEEATQAAEVLTKIRELKVQHATANLPSFLQDTEDDVPFASPEEAGAYLRELAQPWVKEES